MKSFLLNIDGKRVSGYGLRKNDVVWIHVNGKTIVKELSSRRVKHKSGAEVEGVIKAPMPGKIVSIKAKKGEALNENQIIIVMEAMKMEYSLSAPKEAKLKEIHCQEGEQVTLGQVLAELEI